MNADPTRMARARRVAALRRAFGRMARRAGRFRGHVIRRLAMGVGRRVPPTAPPAGRSRPGQAPTMPSISRHMTALGLGLAGGGGGSPGIDPSKA